MSVRRVTPEEAQAAMAEGAIYLDVRTAEEFAGGRPPGAINVPIAVRDPYSGGMVLNPNFLEEVAKAVPKDAPVITGCLRGVRSLHAASHMIADGWTQVVDMRGGWDGEVSPMGQMVFDGWIRRGLPVEK